MRPRIADIARETCAVYGVSIDALMSDRRGPGIARPRQTAMFLARELTLHSLPVIGREIGGRDHSTVIHAVRAVQRRLRVDMALRDDMSLIRQRVLNRVNDAPCGDGVVGD